MIARSLMSSDLDDLPQDIKSSALAVRAIEGRSPSLDNSFNCTFTVGTRTRRIFVGIYIEFMLKVTKLAVGMGVIPQR